MNKNEFWKNFQMGDEIDIAGLFIYNGLKRFHHLQNLESHEELFDALYNLSVGLERLMKVAIVLYDHTDNQNQKEFENSLMTHNHQALLQRLRDRGCRINLDKQHNHLISLLSNFYSKLRYDRFKLSSIGNTQKEFTELKLFLQKRLETELPTTTFSYTPNDDEYRRFVETCILKIASEIFKTIESKATELNLFTDELRHGSKAEKVFNQELDLFFEDKLRKELLIFFMNAETSTGYLRFMKNTPALKFDPALAIDYLECLISDSANIQRIEELKVLYDNLSDVEREERLALIDVMGLDHVDLPGYSDTD